MAEVLFYHLTSSPLEAVLPDLLTRTLDRGWRAVVCAGSEASLKRVDDLLWTFDDASFLPHGGTAMGHDADQPVYLTCGDENPNGASVAMLVAGARVTPEAASAYDRFCLLFDGHDADAVTAAREDWIKVRDAGLTGTYWAQEGGRWTQKASTG